MPSAGSPLGKRRFRRVGAGSVAGIRLISKSGPKGRVALVDGATTLGTNQAVGGALASKAPSDQRARGRRWGTAW